MAFKFVTPEGYQLIKKEFDEIWENIRPNVVEKLAWAASLGDRSENADYQYNKQLLRQIDRRVKFLTDTLKNTEI
ncbi:MAG: transcription elongation factor GreB, partial [Ruminobacter sp.]|nr:transcription elongation factor GreB [Ruminobacter sp.]